MELKEQVISLELAKKLKELGVKQESLYHWTLTHFKAGVIISPQNYLEKPIWLLRGQQLSNDVDRVSAFTVAELGEMLPDNVYSERVSIEVAKVTDVSLKERNSCRDYKGNGFYANTEANARAKMLIYLKEEKDKCEFS